MSRNLIRSHARRNKTGKNAPSGQVAESGPDDPVDEKGGKASIRRSHDLITERSSEGKEIQVWLPSLSTIVLEPFDTLPVGSNKHMQSLLNHCEWFPLSITYLV